MRDTGDRGSRRADFDLCRCVERHNQYYTGKCLKTTIFNASGTKRRYRAACAHPYTTITFDQSLPLFCHEASPYLSNIKPAPKRTDLTPIIMVTYRCSFILFHWQTSYIIFLPTSIIDYRLQCACRLFLFSHRLCYRNTVMLQHIFLFTGSLLSIVSTAFCTV